LQRSPRITNIAKSFTHTRWRRKPAGTDEERNYATVTLRLEYYVTVSG